MLEDWKVGLIKDKTQEWRGGGGMVCVMQLGFLDYNCVSGGQTTPLRKNTPCLHYYIIWEFSDTCADGSDVNGACREFGFPPRKYDN